MKTMSAIAAAVLLAGLAASGSAFAAQGGHGHSGGGSGAARAPSFSAGGSGAGRSMHMPSAHMRSPSIGRPVTRPSTSFAPRHITKPFTGGSSGWKGKPYPGKHIQHGGNVGNGHYGKHRKHRRAYWYGAPFLYDDYAYSYDYVDNGCSVYWNRFLRTGNPKWKYRYYDCID